MKRITSRTKQGQTNPAYEDTDHRDLLAIIEEIIMERQWGCTWTYPTPDTVQLKTIVMGDVDLTTISGSAQEMQAVRNLLECPRGEIGHQLFGLMGIPLTGQQYLLKDVLVIYQLHTEGQTDPDALLSLLTPLVPKLDLDVPTAMARADEVKSMLQKMPGLSSDDGIHQIANSFVLNGGSM